MSKRDVVSAEIQLSDDLIRLSRRRAGSGARPGTGFETCWAFRSRTRVEASDETIPFHPVPLEPEELAWRAPTRTGRS